MPGLHPICQEFSSLFQHIIIHKTFQGLYDPCNMLIWIKLWIHATIQTTLTTEFMANAEDGINYIRFYTLGLDWFPSELWSNLLT